MSSSVLLSLLALFPKILVISSVTFLCLWLAKSWFVFLRGFYMVSARRGGREGRPCAGRGRRRGRLEMMLGSALGLAL